MHKKHSRQRHLRYIATLAGACITSGLSAQTSPAEAKQSDVDADVVILNPFEVTSERDMGYIATETLAGTRIRTDLKDVASAITVITKEFMQDIGATDNGTLLQYTVGAEVAGTRGTYSGAGMTAQTVWESTGISSGQRIRALSSADSTRDYYLSSIPWDSYNIDRIDIQRGPNSILFGLGSPAGIINAGMRNAQYTDSGSVEARIGSYGSVRGTFDVNKTLIDNVLAIRVDGLTSNTNYKQNPAYKNDDRIYVAGRWDPKIFGPNFATSIKVKYEKGSVDANMPRNNPPYDNITPWLDPTSSAYQIDAGSVYTVYDLGTSASSVNPWYAAIMQKQQVAYQIEGTTGNIQGAILGYVNGGYLNSDGSVRGYSDGAIGLRDAFQNYTLQGYANYASNAKLQYYELGQYKNIMLSDSSVFNFYDTLIDGNNKGETADWTTYNIDFTQNGWGDRVGINLSYNYEEYKTNNWSLLGGAPSINVDITKYYQDGELNPNFGRAYVSSSGGSGTIATTERESYRASAYIELRSSDLFDNSFLVKLLGRHRLNGVISKDTFTTDSRSYNLYTASNAWNTYVSGNSNAEWNYRSPMAMIYLGDSLAGLSSSSGIHLPGISTAISFEDTNVYLFDSTWNSSVDPAAAWTPNSAYLQNAYNAGVATTQASNPDNYVGWTSERVLDILKHEDGEGLYTSASRTQRTITSYVGSWQGYMWNDAIVPTLGWRYDTIKTRYKNAGTDASNHRYLLLDDEHFSLPDWEDSSVNRYKSHSLSGGVVVHLNKMVPDSWNKHIPLNVSVSYNESNNFQITDARVDVYGSPISNPQGETIEYGLQLSTKDNRFSFRAIKYETSVRNATISTDTSFHSTINYGLRFRNVFLYQLGSYDWNSRVLANATGTQALFEGETVTYNTRWFWTPAYVDADGRPVESKYWSLYSGRTAPTSYDHLETWAEAIAHRDACIDAWNQIQKYLEEKGYFTAWNYTPTTTAALTTRSEYEKGAVVGSDGKLTNSTYDSLLDTSTIFNYGGSAPSGFAVTADQESEGYEFELTANITDNWRLAFNASKTTAMYMNVGGGTMGELYEYLDSMIDGVAGDMRRWNGDFQDGNELRDDWYGSYGYNKVWSLLKLTEGLASSELRKWKFNVITSYDFKEGMLKGVGVGGAYRWQDKVGIGYRIITDDNGDSEYDLDNPVMGPSEAGTDFWISYKKDLNEKVSWKIQLNISNAFKNEGLIPSSVEPDGTTWAGYRIRPVMEWSLTNTFTF